MKKRVLSFVLALITLASVVPLSAPVAEATGGYTVTVPFKYDAVYDFSDGMAAVATDLVEKDGTYISGKWGFVDVTGKEVIPCKYDFVGHFDNGYAPVARGGETVDTAKWGIVDKTGKEVVPCKYGYGIGGGFTDGLMRVVLDGKYGYVDMTGKEVIPCKYYSASATFSNGMAWVIPFGESKMGFIDKLGNEVVMYNNSSWSPDDGTGGTLRCVQRSGENGKSGYIDYITNREIIPCIYDGASPFYDGLAAVCINGKWGYIDTTGRDVIPFIYDAAFAFSDGRAIVWVFEEPYKTISKVIDKTGNVVMTLPEELNNRYNFMISLNGSLLQVSSNEGKAGFIDMTGKEVVPCIYDFADRYCEGMVRVRLNEKYGFIDMTGKEVVPCIYDYWTDTYFSDGHVKVSRLVGSDVKYGLVDKSGNEIIPCIYDVIVNNAWSNESGEIALSPYNYGFIQLDIKSGSYYISGFVDKTGKEVLPCKYSLRLDFEEGLIYATDTSTGKSGILDIRTMNWIVPCKYDTLRDYFSENLMAAEYNGKWGYIDRTGKEVIPLIYDETRLFNEGLAAVKSANVWKIIDNTGEIVVSLPSELSEVGRVAEGMLTVNNNGKWGAVAITESPTPEPSNSIDSASSWARESIASALSKGFVPSDLQSSYTNVITRAEFCRMAVKWVEYKTGKNIDTVLAEKGVSRDPNAFSDTADEYILAAYALGITSGTGSGRFTPNGQFNREQAAGMIRNTCKAAGMDVSNVTASGFADIGSASSWAVDGINFVNNAGIMSGTGGNNFSPKATYTREQSIVTFGNIK